MNNLQQNDAKPRPFKRLVTTKNGKSERILQENVCPIVDICGKCKLVNLTYKEQILKKAQKLKDILAGWGEEYKHISVKDFEESPEKLSYKHAVHLMISEQAPSPLDRDKKIPKRRIDIGFYQPTSRSVVDIGRCPVQNTQLNHIVAWIRTGIRVHKVSINTRLHKDGILDSVILSATHDAKQAFICFVVTKMDSVTLRPLACDIASKFTNVRGIFMRLKDDTENKNLKLLTGRNTLVEDFLGMTRTKNFESEFAINPMIMEKIVKRIVDLKTQYNQKYSFNLLSTNKFLPTVMECEELDTILARKPDMICFVSSFSTNVEKTFKILKEHGYDALFIEPFDVLPGTEYFEGITLLLKR